MVDALIYGMIPVLYAVLQFCGLESLQMAE